MCGIAGIMTVSGDAPDAAALQSLSAALAHRGPDGDGLAVSGGVGLVHTRLAIIDLETGDQPSMAAAGQGKDNGRENAVLVAHGQIYRPEERRVGQECRSRGSPYH